MCIYINIHVYMWGVKRAYPGWPGLRVTRTRASRLGAPSTSSLSLHPYTLLACTLDTLLPCTLALSSREQRVSGTIRTRIE